jgi:subtilase family serine protease
MYKKNFIRRLCLFSLVSIFVQFLPVQSFAVELTGVPDKTDLPDLTVTRVYFTPARPTIKDRVTINVEIKNIGSGPAYFSTGITAWETTEAPTANANMGARPQGIGLQFDEVLSGKIVTPTPIVLKPGESYVSSQVVVSSGKLAPGEYPYAVKVNPEGKIGEADKTNNEQKGLLKMRGLAGR